jgi:hypothetical protein
LEADELRALCLEELRLADLRRDVPLGEVMLGAGHVSHAGGLHYSAPSCYNLRYHGEGLTV